MTENTIPNDHGSKEGVWYHPPNIAIKIEPIEKDPDPDDTYPGTKYKMYVAIPTPYRKGIAIGQVELTNNDEHSWMSRYSQGDDNVERLQKRLKDYKRTNKALQHRNHDLERHFTKTVYDERRQDHIRNGKLVCEGCNVDLDLKNMIEGKDYIFTGEEHDLVYHLECAVKEFESVCSKCGILWSSDVDAFDKDEQDEVICPECGGSLEGISSDEVRKKLHYDALKKYLPKELHDKVKIQT